MVSEIDCARVYSVSGQEMIRKLPDFLVNIYVSGSVSPGAELRLATEEFMKGSHRADEYIRRYLTIEDLCVNGAKWNHVKWKFSAFCGLTNTYTVVK